MLYKLPSWPITNSFLLPTDQLHTGHVCPCKALSVKITRRRSPESRLAAEAEAGMPPTKPEHAVSQAWGGAHGKTPWRPRARELHLQGPGGAQGVRREGREMTGTEAGPTWTRRCEDTQGGVLEDQWEGL